MTNEEIIRMAHEAGLHIATDHDWMPIIALAYAKKFAEVARAEEREACAKVCENMCGPIEIYNPAYVHYVGCAEAIRARGQHD
jgi:hypothetical protein